MKPNPFLLNAVLASFLFVSLTGGIYLIAKTSVIDSTTPIYQQINLEGIGKAKAEPTVATIRAGVITQGKDVNTATQENTQKMNAMIEAFKKLLPEEDIQTEQYTVSPEYVEGEAKTREISGYLVEQTVVLKIRDHSKTQEVLAKATELGSNTISGPEFTFDDETHLIDEARVKALADLSIRKDALEKALDVKLKKIIGYSEYVDRGGGPTPYYRDLKVTEAMGAPVPPTIETGTLEITLHVNVQYGIE